MILRGPFSASLRLHAVLIAFAIFAIGTRIAAQTSKTGGIIQGSVADATGAVVPGAAIVIRNISTNQTRNLATSDHGFFRSGELPPGTYDIEVSQPGFAPSREQGVEVTLGATLRLDIVLTPSPSSTQVTVKAQPSPLDASQTSMVSSVDQERIEELPVRSRNYLDFVLLAPGVSTSPARPLVPGATPISGSGFTFGGLRPRSNNLSIDGLDNNDEFSGSSRTELSPEIVQEFQVVNNGLSAESGGASGGSINVITRSGSNLIHGDAFIFAQDSSLDARDPFETDPAKPYYRRFRAGFALGGPIVQDKTFYYVAAEQEHSRGQIGSDIDPAEAAALSSFLASGAFPGLPVRSILTGFWPTSRAETEAAGKLDHQLTKNTALMLRYAFTNAKEAGDAFNAGGLMDASAAGSSVSSDNALSGAITTAGPLSTSDWRFQLATRRVALNTAQQAGPQIDIAGLVSFGDPYNGNGFRRENHYQTQYAYSRVRGRHLWKAGATVSRVRLRADLPNGFGGSYLFGSLADFFAGRAAQFRQAFGSPSVDFPVTVFGGFAQDHWSVNAHLTVDLGTRYDFERLPGGFNQDTNNLSPRVGLAWSPASRWVFRAGYGIFFDRYILANLARAVEKDGVHAYEQVVDTGMASTMFFDRSGGSAAAPLPGIGESIFRADPRMATPYSQQASAGAEYLLGAGLTFSANYLFVRGVKLPRTVNVNLRPPSVLTAADAADFGLVSPPFQQLGREAFPAQRLDPSFDDIYQLQDSASSTYNGLSLTFARQMNEDLEFSGSYTLSRTIDDASDFDEQPQNPYDLAAERGRSRQDQPQRFVFNALWDLPIGEGEENGGAKSASHPGWLTRTFSHIELAPIFSASSGQPVNPLTGLDSNLTHSFPLSSRPIGFGRNSMRAPATAALDLRILKYFPFGPSRHLDVVAESFNLLNRANVAQINSIFGSGAIPLPGFGQPIEGLGARQIQFSLDYEF